ncbi:MAG TPA: malonic semialdehyde reductase [Steroidobacteraceae bacterium]
MNSKLTESALEQMFGAARSHSTWIDRSVEDALLREVYRLASLGPTSANCCPARFVFVRTAPGRELLAQHVFDLNKVKVRTAPVTLIVGQDPRFYEEMGRLCPQRPQFAQLFAGNAALADVTAFRNSTLQGAYVLMAARALGLDTGPMSGFDHPGVDAAFFPDGRVKSNFLCCLGYADSTQLHPRLPRLGFDEACRLV